MTTINIPIDESILDFRPRRRPTVPVSFATFHEAAAMGDRLGRALVELMLMIEDQAPALLERGLAIACPAMSEAHGTVERLADAAGLPPITDDLPGHKGA